jgi:hypothetical protein
MLRGLADANVACVVVGGVAGTVHGSVHVTNDLDICYDTSPENIARLAALLAQWQAYPRGIEPGLPFFMDARTFRTTPTMTLQTTEGALGVLDRVAGVGDYEAAFARSDPFEAFGVEFRALDLPALIAAKRAAGRPKDLAQIPELEALRALQRRDRA